MILLIFEGAAADHSQASKDVDPNHLPEQAFGVIRAT